MRRDILVFIKTRDIAFVRDVAEHFGLTHEGARKQLVRMEEEGWLERKPSLDGVGRPRDAYSVTAAGDAWLPKAYDKLATLLMSRETLAELARGQVEAWKPKLEGKALPEKLQALRELYVEADPFTSLEISEKEARFTERNCPFLNVALEHPALCSLTVNTLEGLLGHPVIREEKFQAGHGRCVFRVLLDRPLAEDAFTLESERLPPRAA
jgi:predicted ArsR family transcriptional regulator